MIIGRDFSFGHYAFGEKLFQGRREFRIYKIALVIFVGKARNSAVCVCVCIALLLLPTDESANFNTRPWKCDSLFFKEFHASSHLPTCVVVAIRA